MGAMASQITGVPIVSSTVCSDTDQIKHLSSASPALWGESTAYRRIPLIKGQQRGKFFHFMMPWNREIAAEKTTKFQSD